MNFGQLLDELRVGLLNDRSNNTGDSDLLWSDARLKTYINEAQRRYADQSFCIRDGRTDEVTKITLVEGQAEYTLHSSVITIISAKVEGQSADLVRAGHPTLSNFQPPSERWYDPILFTAMAPGPAQAYSTDEGVVEDDNGSMVCPIMRIYPTPDSVAAGTVIRLRVVRGPLQDMQAAGDVPEIPDHYHLEMLDWAAYLALRIVDDDAGSPARAREFQAQFNANTAAARKEVLRKLFTPTEFGFGRNGWAWSTG